ncbi:VanZ family protein [Bacillus sp. USDA818B3_A]|uniref:VanZ family protein n=1 Tax=Bacillus sp. USDA818B3_A TaxID=2698834 RepID=UPI001368072C|nr:VanZ family protein [Bacillus sp. USDA818B3_A]
MIIQKRLVHVLFLLAIVFIISLTLIADPTGTREHRYNFIPFKIITRILFHKSLYDIILNIAGNIILFLPFGFLLPLSWRKVNTIYKAILIGALLSITVECAQIIYPDRLTDIDDVILNTLGAALGYRLFVFTVDLVTIDEDQMNVS